MLLLRRLVCVSIISLFPQVIFGSKDLETDEEEHMKTKEEDTDMPTPMVAVSGGRAALPCDISSDIEKDEVYIVLFYKDDIANPIYSLDARKGEFGQARHATSDTLAGRARFSSSDKPAVLQLDKVYEADQGLYSCRVDFRKARTRHSAIMLSVVVPPNPPIIKDFNGEVLNGVIGPYNEGDSLHLICQTEGGKPPPRLIWWKRRKLLDQSYEEISPGLTRNELTIAKLQRKDLLATISCKATNNALTSPAEASVTIDINFRPLSVNLKDKGRPLSANKTVLFECEVSGSRPPAVISWRKGSTKLKSSQNSKVLALGNVTTSEHTLTLTSEDNGKFLYCQGENPVIPGSSIEDGWKLEVHYVPQLSLRYGSKLASMNIVEGDDVYFECNIRATPWVYATGWTLNGKELKTDLSAGVIVSNQSLVLHKVQRVSRGRYSCTAKNTEGQGESNTVYLRVQYSPVCKTSRVWTHGAILHYPVQISCEVEADPDDVAFWWEFNSTVTGAQQYQPTYTSGTRSTLNYMPRSESDFGSLLCFARNPIGPQRIPCTYLVVPAEAPSPVHNCTFSEETRHSFRVSCSEGRDGGLNQYFYIEVRDEANNFVLQNVSAHTADFVADGLRPGVAYAVSIFASNVKGRSAPAVLQAMTLAKPETQTSKGDDWPTNFTGIFLLVSGVSGGLTLTVVLMVLVRMKLRSAERRSNNKSKTNALANEKEKSAQNSEKSGDTCSDGYNCAEREDEKVWDSIPDVVVFSDMGKPGENEQQETLAFSSFALWDSLGAATPPVISESGEPYPHHSHHIKMKSPVSGDQSWSNWVPDNNVALSTSTNQTDMQQQQFSSSSIDPSPGGTMTRLKQKFTAMQTDV